MDTQTDVQPESTEPVDGDGRRNERSTIAFPYGSLQDAEEIATAVHHWGGSNVSMDSIAAALNPSTTVKSGTFRTKIATSRTFGVVDGRGDLSLSKLGWRLVDPEQSDAARVDAFLHVPLFRAIFDAFKGQMLPSNNGLQQKMVQLGVSYKQAVKARQAFQRSAEHAGFFAHGRNRLVIPNVKNGNAGNDKPPDDPADKIDPIVYDRTDLRPEVIALLATLVNDGADWSNEKIAEFVSTARKLNELLGSS